jgi:hypothetical protein
MSGQGKAAQASYYAGGLVFLAVRMGGKASTHPSNPRRLVICVSQGMPAECAFQQVLQESPP